MYILFDQLSDQARVWIYQANRELIPEEQKTILQASRTFLKTWNSHGRPLQGSVVLLHSRFLILGLEKPVHKLSCCTLDSATHFMYELKDSLKIDLLARDLVIFKQGDSIVGMSLSQARQKVAQGEIAPETRIFDNTITHKGDLVDRWLVPVQDSWLGQSIRSVASVA